MNSSQDADALHKSKSELRVAALAKRDALPAEERAAAATAMAERVFPILIPAGAIVSGAGYYDMTIARIRAMKPVTAVGLAFAAQEADKVPAEPHDAPLDLVLTEKDVIDFRRQ